MSVFDEHTLYVLCERATKEQLTKVFSIALRYVNKAMGKTIDCKFRINLVDNKDGRSLGFAFVFVTDSQFYHALLGRNADGSERINYVLKESVSSNQGNSWADICEDEEPD